jgi:hypothetical protein
VAGGQGLLATVGEAAAAEGASAVQQQQQQQRLLLVDVRRTLSGTIPGAHHIPGEWMGLVGLVGCGRGWGYAC